MGKSKTKVIMLVEKPENFSIPTAYEAQNSKSSQVHFQKIFTAGR